MGGERRAMTFKRIGFSTSQITNRKKKYRRKKHIVNRGILQKFFELRKRRDGAVKQSYNADEERWWWHDWEDTRSFSVEQERSKKGAENGLWESDSENQALSRRYERRALFFENATTCSILHPAILKGLDWHSRSREVSRDFRRPERRYILGNGIKLEDATSCYYSRRMERISLVKK